MTSKINSSAESQKENQNINTNMQQQQQEDKNVQSSNYQMRPGLQDAFKGNIIKGIINTVLHEVLEGKKYTQTDIADWTKEIADEINNRTKDLAMRRYKHIVQVMMAQQTGAGLKYVARCRWDAECDNQITNYFTNESIVCVVTVFGVYLY